MLNLFKHELRLVLPSQPIKIRWQRRQLEERAWPSQTPNQLSKGQLTNTALMRETMIPLRRDQPPSRQVEPYPEPLVPQTSNFSAINRTGSVRPPVEDPPLKKQTHFLRTMNILDQDMKQESKK